MDWPHHTEQHPSEIQSPCSEILPAASTGKLPRTDFRFSDVSSADTGDEVVHVVKLESLPPS